MEIISDLHLHSKYSRAVSQNMDLDEIAKWSLKKGIGLVGSADWTHPMWIREIKTKLDEVGEGVFALKKSQGSRGVYKGKQKVRFVLTTEISCIYKQDGKSRRIHILVLAPEIKTVEQINKSLTKRGLNLGSDGRPILGISAKDLAEIVLGVNNSCLIIPAHIWTPWYSLYGSASGFDSMDECFGKYSRFIYAVETGLSSDPAMNWTVKDLKERNIVSFGDSHSAQKLGREATVFELEKVDYESLRLALLKNTIGEKSIKKTNSKSSIKYTIEFYPEEGKYHYSGHKKCNIVYGPEDIEKRGLLCPVCGKPLTMGVSTRVNKLSSLKIQTENKIDKYGVRFINNKSTKRPPYVTLVPLLEILSESLGLGVPSKRVQSEYETLLKAFGGEFDILLKTPIKDIEKFSGRKIAKGILKVRRGDIAIKPGYDGEFGEVNIWSKDKIKERQNGNGQTYLF